LLLARVVAALAAAALWLPATPAARWAAPADAPVVIWSVTDSRQYARNHCRIFAPRSRSPVKYREMKTQDLNSEYLAQVQRGAVSPTC
jgi:hypothetical protein